MKSRPHIVFMSLDGLLEPLGYSQVVRVAKGLAGTGRYQMTLVSLEKAEDLGAGERFPELSRELARAGVGWEHRVWASGGGPVEAARNLRSLYEMLTGLVVNKGVDLIHARSYVPATIARQVGRVHKVPYLFDIRGYWVDERLEQGRWFGGALRIRAARRWERGLYRDAAGVVSLTELAAQDIREKKFGPWPAGKPVQVIPTCVDYGEFGLGGPGDARGISKGLAKRLQTSLVVGFVGAVSQMYCVEESIALFDELRRQRPDAHLLCLTRNPPALLSIFKRRGIPQECYTVRTVAHDEIAAWLPYMDWGLLLRREAPSHRAAMPTKLAEFFASGVRPIQWGCNAEVRQWVERAGGGLVLKDLEAETLRGAAAQIARAPGEVEDVLGARWRTRRHFDLQFGVARYGEIYDELLASKGARAHRRVLFLTEGTTVPASRFRVEQLVPYFEERGIDCTVRPAYGDGYHRWSRGVMGPIYKFACSLQRLPYIADADRFDVVFVQRPALPFSAALEQLARWRNPRIIFDVDDAIFVGPDGEERPWRRRAFEEVVAASSHVICGNEYLARITRPISPTTVIPTVVNANYYRPAPGPRKKEGDVVRLGWMGTSSNFGNLELVVPVLRRLLQRFPHLQVQLISDQVFEPLKGVAGVEQIPWRAREEVERLQGFDLGIMPLKDNRATRGKCGFKAIQYMAVGIPVVASAVGANNEILEGESAGFLARDPDEFEEALRRLIQDEELRHRMGQAGRARVEARYCIEAVLHTYLQLFYAVARQEIPGPPEMERERQLLIP